MNLVKHPLLREKILERLRELEFSQSFIVNDASERGMKIASDRLSRYLNNKEGGMITEDQLIWLATRLGIDVSVNLGKLVVDGDSANFIIPPYNELSVLNMLKRKFPPRVKNNG